MTELIRLFYALDTFILRVSINLCLYEHITESLFRAVPDHALKIGAVIVRPRHRTVYVGVNYYYIILCGILFANSELPFDRLLGLTVRAVSGINDCHIFLWTLFIKYCYTTKFNFSFQKGFDGYCDYFLADCFICE